MSEELGRLNLSSDNYTMVLKERSIQMLRGGVHWGIITAATPFYRVIRELLKYAIDKTLECRCER